MIKICSACGNEYTTNHSTSKYCSKSCSHQGRIKGKEVRHCLWCQKKLSSSKVRPGRGKYCNASCYHAHVKSGVSGANGWVPSEEQKAHISAGIIRAFQDESRRANRSRVIKSWWAELSEEEHKKRTKQLALAGIQHQQLHTKISPLEIAICEVLDALGIEYRRQERIADLLIDIYIPSQNLVIEVQGCYWHECEQCGYAHRFHQLRVERDKQRKAIITGMGYKYIEIWEHDVRVDPAHAFLKAIGGAS